MKRFCAVFLTPFVTLSSAAPRPSPRQLKHIGPCAFIAMQTRGERVLGTCLDHIFVARESETIVTFSCGAGGGHSPFPREDTIAVLSVGILG